jgi:MHS family shikimate/dehydroshikimate transporter-like MFS transporter
MATPGSTEPEKSISKAALVAFSSLFGWGFELFDFTAFLFAATLFAPYFFPASDANTSVLYAFATSSIAFFARPFGGFIFGHYGDKLGRKSVWFIALLGMGIISFLMGCLPTYQQVGIFATIALVFCRVLQGIFLSGEQAGGWVLIAEVSPAKWRAFFGGIVGAGSPFGQVLLSIAIFVASALAPGSLFAVWGWRIIFWVGVLPLIVALVVRYWASESIEWKAKAQPKIEKIPFLTALRADPKFFLVIFCSFAGQALFIYGSVTFLPSFFRLYTALPPASIAYINMAQAITCMIAAPIWGVISDVKKTRRRFIAVAFMIDALMIYPIMTVMGWSQIWPAIFAGIVLGFFTPMAVGVQPAWIAENTRTSVRYSFTAVASGFGSAVGGLAPYLVVQFSPALGAVYATTAVAIFGCLLASFTALFSPPDRVMKELD